MAVNKTLYHPNSHKASLNEEEELFVEAYNLYDSLMIKAINDGYTKEYRGIDPSLNYLGGNVHIYLMYYALILRNKVQAGTPCDELELECLEKRLKCLSSELGFDYVNLWVRFKELFNITNCDAFIECCPGIGEAVIDSDECESLIIGECDAIIEVIEPSGEFSPCEFVIDEFTEAVGNPYENCN